MSFNHYFHLLHSIRLFNHFQLDNFSLIIACII
jgi:hypothetical protein